MINKNIVNSVPVNGPAPSPTTDVFFGGAINGSQLNSVTINGRSFDPSTATPFGGQINSASVNSIQVNGRDFAPIVTTIVIPINAEHRMLYYFTPAGNSEFEHRMVYPFNKSNYEHTILFIYEPAGNSNFEHIGLYDVFTGPVSFEHRMLYKASFDFEHTISYEIREQKSFEHLASYDILTFDRLEAEHRMLYRFDVVEFEHGLSYDILQTFAIEHTTRYDINAFEPANFEHRMLYRFNISEFEHTSAYSIREDSAFEHRTTYNIFSDANFEHGIEYDILSFTPVNALHTAVYSILEPTVIDITGVPSITIVDKSQTPEFRQSIMIVNAQIGRAENQPYWTCEISLGAIEDFQQFQQDTFFELDLFGEIYAFIVDSKEMSRDAPVNRRATINGVSPLIRADAPRAQPVLFEQVDAINVLTLFDDIMALSGMTVTVSPEVVDGSIPPFRVGAASATPLAHASDIAKKLGLILESPRNDEDVVLLRRLFPQDTPLYILPTAIIADTFNDADNIFRVSEQFVPSEVVNELRIFDSQGSFRDKIVFELDDAEPPNPRLAFATLYPSPARLPTDASPVLENINVNNVGIALLSEGNETISQEIITFTAGIASVSFPIYSLNSINWIGTDLGGVTFVEGSTTIQGLDVSANGGYAIASITYVTKFFKYRLQANAAETIDLLIATQS